MDLAQERVPVTTDEIAAILGQIDLLYQYASLLKPKDADFPFCRILQQLARQENIQRMVRDGASPRLIRAIRLRRACTFESCLTRMTVTCALRIRKGARAARESGEWLLWAGAAWRHLRLRWYLLRLRIAHRAYLAGLPVNIAPVLRKLELLAE